MIIDTHQHFWIYNPAEYKWIGENMSILARNFLPVDIHSLLTPNDIEGTIAVQARQTTEETQWLLKLSEQNAFIKGVVGWVDLQARNCAAQLKQFSQNPKFLGVRHVLHDEIDDNFMLRPEFLNGIELMGKYDLSYDILIFPKHLPATYEFIKRFPEQRFVIDHLAKPSIKEHILSPWNEYISRLAEYSNVYCKISGLVTEADWDNWVFSDFRAYLDIIFDVFGTNRVMFGSDWPVCMLAASYNQVIQILQTHLDKNNFSEIDQNAIWRNNSLDFYKFDL